VIRQYKPDDVGVGFRSSTQPAQFPSFILYVSSPAVTGGNGWISVQAISEYAQRQSPEMSGPLILPVI